MLRQALTDGSKFYKRFNDTRMRLAFDLFSEDMKKALYEILFFLHVNDPKYANHHFPCKEIQEVNGVKKEVEIEGEINLFVEGAPTGVVGIEHLNAIFREDFIEFVTQELQGNLTEVQGYAPIYSVASLGSIGTVGHKQIASDLDLQVQYELAPFLISPEELDDAKLTLMAKGLSQYYARLFGKKKGLKAQQMRDPEIKKQLLALGRKELIRRFPKLYGLLLTPRAAAARGSLKDLKFAAATIDEIIRLHKDHARFVEIKKRKELDAILKDKISRIQTYVQKKYPEAEVYLFAYSNDDYRAGKHGTTLESKEASGSAYEKILNYETLMPGIQFTPMVPVHFLMPPEVNADAAQYERLVNYSRFHFIEIYDFYRPKMVDLGSTPPLTREYMVAHAGAIYWEAFKASSGNLPKALLNLLRIEMLFDPKFNRSIIELIKDPAKFDGLIPQTKKSETQAPPLPPWDEDFFIDYGKKPDALGLEKIGRDEKDQSGGLPIAEILEFEADQPILRMDPWWLRYKALKIAFGPSNKAIGKTEQDLLSRMIDLCFALHLKIADVFGKKDWKSYREKVLGRFLAYAFPKVRRGYLEHIFSGEVAAVNRFELELKLVFKNSMNRVNQLVERLQGQDKTNRDEYKIWYHYYEKNFEPPENQVRQDILGHLRQARGRLQMGYRLDKKLWYFKSIQKGTKYTKAGDLDHLPDEVLLFSHPSFLHGIAHCVMNSYYGVYNQGTLMESRTSVEFDLKGMKLGKRSADEYGYITPDMAVRLFEKIDQALPPQKEDYRDCIYKKREVVDIFVALNLAEFGRLSILYRDNLKIWKVEEVDHPNLEAKAEYYHSHPDNFWEQHELFEGLDNFLMDQGFEVDREKLQHMTFWVNPNSLLGGGAKPEKKEAELSRQFEQAFLVKLGYSESSEEEGVT